MNANWHSEILSKLVLLPRLSDDLQALNPAIQGILGYAKTVNFLTNNNFKGVLVRPQPETLLENASNDLVSSHNVSHGCMYIPAPKFDRIVVIKNITDLSRIDSVTQITNAVQEQMLYLNEVVSVIKRDSNIRLEEVPVDIYLTSPAKITKCSATFEELVLSVKSSRRKSPLYQLQIEVASCKDRELKSKLDEDLKIRVSKSGLCYPIIQYFAKFRRLEAYQLKATELKFLNSEPSTLYDVENVTKVFDFFFRDRLKKMYTVPELNQLSDNLLYCTNEKGDLDRLSDYGAYMGEVQLFSKQILATPPKKSGVLLKSFTNRHLESIINPAYIQPQNFEMDWIYLGGDKIVVFEVGLSKNPSESNQLIKNKITQCLTKIIPQMQLIVYSVLRAFQKRNNADLNALEHDLNKNLKFCIYFPQLSEKALRLKIKQLKNSMTSIDQQHPQQTFFTEEFLHISIQQRDNITNKLFFLVTNDITHSLKLQKIDSNFDLVDSDEPIEGLLESSAISSDGNLFHYACSLLAIASVNYCDSVYGDLKTKTALDVDERYLSWFHRWLMRHKAEKRILLPDHFKFVLSPQQHRILREVDKTHLVITGQPGTGKTTLLLAKCQQMASFDKIDKFLFLYDSAKSIYRKQLEKLIHTNCSRITTDKLFVLDICSGEHTMKRVTKGVKYF